MKLRGLGMVMALAALALSTVSCGGERRAVDEENQDTATAEQDVSFDFDEVYSHLNAGDHEAALMRLREALADLPGGPDKETAFVLKIDLLLRENRLADAQHAYLEALSGNPRGAERAHGMIERFLEFEGGTEDVLPWAQRVLQAGPPPDLRQTYLRMELLALHEIREMEGVLQRLDDYRKDLEPAALAALGLSLAEQMIGDSLIDDAGRFQQWLAAAGAREEVYRQYAALLSVELLIARNRWDELVGEAQQALHLLDEDEDALSRFDRWCRAAMRSRQFDVADRLAESFMSRYERFPRTAVRAARWWVAIPWEHGDRDEALSRFETLAAGETLPMQTLAPFVEWMAAAVFNAGTREQTLRFLELSDALPWSEIGEDARGRNMGVLLDLSFNVSDYERSIALLNEGVPDYDARWHEVMLNKVYAHKAEDAGRTDEAVRRFRRFMDDIVEEPDRETLIDPVTGHRVTDFMILALNARRIGNILAADGRVEEAESAYAEAVGYYRQAIEEVGSGTPEAAWIREQITEMR